MCVWVVVPTITNEIKEVNMDSGYKSTPTKNMHGQCQWVFPFMPARWSFYPDVNLGMVI